MTVGITHLANLTIQIPLSVYYTHAFHRLTNGHEHPKEPAPLRNLHFLRGMMHFEPASPFLSAIRASGFQSHIFRFPSEGEKNLLRSWRENTSDAVRHFLAHPEALGDRPVFCGHSAGGLTVYALAALAKGGRVEAIQKECPGLDAVPIRSLERLGEDLSHALFVTIAAPLQGVRLTRVGRYANQLLVEPFAPLLFEGLTEPNLQAFYERIGRRPDEVIDANLVSSLSKPSFYGGTVSKVSILVIQGGMRALSPFLDHESEGDGIVPKETAVLNGPLQVFAPHDHLSLVEAPEAASILVDLIRQSDGRPRPISPLS